MTLTERETQTYADALALPHYADFSPGEKYADLFASLVSERPRASVTVLDAGCGTGKGMSALSHLGFMVRGCDLTGSGMSASIDTDAVDLGVSLWRPIQLWKGERYDYVYCTDVLEHIPPQFTMLVVRNLLDACTRGVFLSISLVPDQFGAWVGRPLHQSVRRYDEWLVDLRELATVTDSRDLGHAATFMLEPR